MQITAEQATFLFDSILPTFENEHRLTTKVLKAIPADKADYRPDPTSKSALDLSWHLATTENFFTSSLPKGEFAPPPTIEKAKTMGEVVEFYVENFKRNLAALKGMSGEQLAKVMDFKGMFQLPAVGFIGFVNSHTIHHRGQLSVYLRPMGSKVPSIYGESYDDAQERVAKAGAPA